MITDTPLLVQSCSVCMIGHYVSANYTHYLSAMKHETMLTAQYRMFIYRYLPRDA